MVNFRLIRRLWLFLAVAEERHFGRAAKRLGMSQPPLTEQIQLLEHELKVKLFERSRHGTQLTPEGAAILPAVIKFSEHLTSLELAVREAAAGQQQVLTIGAVSSAMMDVLPSLIPALKASRPGLTVAVREIDSRDAVPALESGLIDLAFARLDMQPSPSIASLPVREDRLAVALPRHHPSVGKQKIELASLAGEEFIMFYRHISPNYFDSIVGVCRASGFSPRIVHEVGSVMSQIAFVGCGQGVALVPSSFRRAAPDSVVIVPLHPEVEAIATMVAWNVRRTTAATETALALLKAPLS